MNLSAIKLSKKLPLTMLGLALLSAVITGTVITINSANILNKNAEEKLKTVEDLKASSLNNYLISIQQDLRIMAQGDYVRQAIYDFGAAWSLIEGDKTEVLQELYIEKNPHPLGQKENLDYADDDSYYSTLHKKYHPFFRNLLREREYYDIFLFDTEGNLIYSVFKELDYATNLNTGEWKDSDLGNAFRAAKNNPVEGFQKFFDFKPYGPSHGAPASFLSQPVLGNDGELIGVMVYQMPIGRINYVMDVSEDATEKEIKKISSYIGETAEVYIVGSDHLMRNDSRLRIKQKILNGVDSETDIMKTYVKTEAVDRAIAGERGVIKAEGYRGYETIVAYGPITIGDTTWAVIAEISSAEINEGIQALITQGVMYTFLVMVLVCLIALYTSRKITKPITEMTGAMGEIAKDNFAVEIPGTERSDEIGEMASAVQIFKDNGQNAKQLAADQAMVEKRAEAEKKKIMNELAEKFDSQVGGMIRELSQSSEKLQGASDGISSKSEETLSSSSSVAAAAEETSANVSTVASATEEMTASAQEISKQIADVAAKASMTSSSANSTSQKVDELNELVVNIGEVVTAIKGIAEQTNLLALNATIEAARAGEAGKGFAVVADEVKKLANETAKKTDEIEDRITHIQEATQSSVQAMQEIITNIADIDAASAGTAGAVEEQNAVIQEITRNISEVSEASRDVANIIIKVQSAASETGDASNVLKTTANDITSLSSSLGKSVHDFLAQIKSDNKDDDDSVEYKLAAE